MGMRFSNERIAISKTIQAIIANRHSRSAALIPNGVDLPEIPNTCSKVREFGFGAPTLRAASQSVRAREASDRPDSSISSSRTGWLEARVSGQSRSKRQLHSRGRARSRRKPKCRADRLSTRLSLRELFGHAGCSCCLRRTRDYPSRYSRRLASAYRHRERHCGQSRVGATRSELLSPGKRRRARATNPVFRHHRLTRRAH